jgi:hypothetical protein
MTGGRLFLPRVARRALIATGRALRGGGQPKAAHLGYIRVDDTTRAAKAKGLSVSQYVEQLWDQVGHTEAIIRRLESDDVFSSKGGRIVEIGPGTGRYLERVIDCARPSEYQIYEVAEDWRDWLKNAYPDITACRADGKTLAETGCGSANVILAFGVFVYLSFMTSHRYFFEIWRTAAVGSFVVFDIISEKSVAGPLLDRWIRSGWEYPTFLSSKYVVELFKQAGFSLIDSFVSKHGPAVSEFLVFRRTRSGSSPESVPPGKRALI